MDYLFRFFSFSSSHLDQNCGNVYPSDLSTSGCTRLTLVSIGTVRIILWNVLDDILLHNVTIDRHKWEKVNNGHQHRRRRRMRVHMRIRRTCEYYYPRRGTLLRSKMEA